MKSILKLITGLLGGIAAGLLIGGALSVAFTDTTFADFARNMASANAAKIALSTMVALATFIASIAILIPVHEAGHLVCGLLTGYKFVSFRVFNLTLIKVDGRITVKKFAVAGTGGQCLLSPPDLPLELIPTGWYNAGGILANLLVLVAALPLFMLNLHPLATEALAIFCITAAILILLNSIPMKLSGISNDGYNIIYLNRNPLSKRAIVLQLRTNMLIQNGMRPKEMPAEWFEWRTDIDYTNPLEVSMPLMYSSRLLDEMKFEEAYQGFSQLYAHRANIMQLYVNEIACELAFCAMITGRMSQAEELLDYQLQKYISTYKKVTSSKQRIASAIALYLHQDRATAENIYLKLQHDQPDYLLQGEVKSDLAIMDRMLRLPAQT